jgi:hypothetical protein
MAPLRARYALTVFLSLVFACFIVWARRCP